MKNNFIALIAVLVSISASAQTLETSYQPFTKKDQNLSGLMITMADNHEDIAAGFAKYLSKNYKVSTSKADKSGKQLTYFAEKVKLKDGHTASYDVVFKSVEKDEESTTLYFAGALGYDVFASATQNPEIYKDLDKILKAFAKEYQLAKWAALLKTAEKSEKKLKKTAKKLEKSSKKNEESIKKLQEEIKDNEKELKENKQEISKSSKTISKLNGYMKNLK